MEFLNPNFLWALFLIAIPVIVHLFYFRRYKKVYFSNVRFLKSVKEEQSTWRKIRNLLVLLARILVIAFLVFAFAQPFIPTGNQKMGDKAVSLYIDNSFSMNARGEAVNLVEQAKNRAFEIIQSQDIETQFQVVSNGFKTSSARWVNQEEAMGLVEEIELRPEVRDLSTVLQYQNESFEKVNAEQKVRFLLSDLQKSTTTFPDMPDTSILTYFLPLKAVRSGNVAVDSVWLDAPVLIKDQSSNLYVRLTNFGSQQVENVRLSVIDGGENRPFGQRDIAASSSVIDTISLTPSNTGWQEATIQINDYPVQFDDTYYISYQVPKSVAVLVLQQENTDRYLDAALKGIPSIRYVDQNIARINYAEFSQYDLIIVQDLKNVSSGLQNALDKYIRSGGNVLMFPPKELDVQEYNMFLQKLGARPVSAMRDEEAEVFQMQENAFIFSDVFETRDQRLQLPKVSAFLQPSGSGAVGEENLLRFRNGDPYLSQYNIENGYLFFSYAPLSREFNSLTTDGEIFIPLIFRAALISNQNNDLAYTIGETNSFSIKKELGVGEADYRITGAFDFIPLQRNMGSSMLIDLQQQITEAGFYNLMVGDSLARKLAFNYHRSESDLNAYTIEELSTLLPENWQVMEIFEGQPISQKVNQAVSGIELWKWCIILTLVFLAFEQLILRFWKIE